MKRSCIIRIMCLFLAAIFVCGTASGCASPAEAGLVTDVSSVPAMQQEVSITCQAVNASFNKAITADTISLAGAFEGMDVQVDRTAKDTAVVTLSGDMRTDPLYDTYLYGYIYFDEGSFSDKELTLSTSIYVVSPNCHIYPDSLTFRDGTLSGVIDIAGYQLAETASANDITVDGKAVTSAQVRDNAIAFSIQTTASDLDAAVAELDGKEIVVKSTVLNAKNDHTFARCFSQASFYCNACDIEYPADDTARTTFSLVTVDGSFADTLGKQDITLAGDLADATIETLTVSDNTAQLTLTFPASRFDESDHAPGVLISLGVGSLVNAWGTKNTEARSYYCCAETRPDLGSATENFATVAGFCSKVSTSALTKGLSTLCPEAGMAVSLITGAISATYDLCKLAGILDEGESDLEVICRQFHAIAAQLSEQNNKLNQILDVLKEQQLNTLRDQTYEFTAQVMALEAYATEISNYIKCAANDPNIVNADGTIPDMYTIRVPESSLGDISEKMLENYTSSLADGDHASITDEMLLATLTEEEQAIVQEWTTYYQNLLNNIQTRAQVKNSGYAGYEETLSKLKAKFKELCISIATDGGNYFRKYDELCTSIYLFDVTSLSARRVYRATAKAAIDHAMTLFMQACSINETDTELKNLVTLYYKPATDAINGSTVQRDYYDYDDFMPGLITFYPQTIPAIHCRYVKVSADLGYENVYNASETKDIQKKVEKHFQDLKKFLFANTLDSSEIEKTKSRLRKLGYQNYSRIDDCMGYEVNAITNEMGLATVNGGNPCVYLANYDSVTVNWKDVADGSAFSRKSMEITFNGATLYNIDTGEKMTDTSYTMSYDERTWDNVYILFMSSTHKK